MSSAEPAGESAVLDALNIGLLVVDAGARVTMWNAWLAAASGIAPAVALGKTLRDLFPDAKLDRLEGAIADAIDVGASSVLSHALHPFLLPLRTRSGRGLVHNLSVRPIAPKPYAGCVIQIADVTSATEREQVLRARQNARYDAVVDSAGDAILTIDMEGRIQLANPAAIRHFGDGMPLVGVAVATLFDDPAVWQRAFDQMVHGARLTETIELSAQRPRRERVFVEVSAARWSTEARHFVTAILRDVTARKAAQEALSALNQTLEDRVEERTADRDRMWRLSTDVMLVARFDGTITAVNPAWTTLLGWSEADLVGQKLELFVDPDDSDRLAEILAELSVTFAPRLFELNVRTRQGERRIIEWSAVRADDVLQAVGRDATAERSAAQALRDTEEALRQAQKMEAIGQLTGGIAHDFNNLLTGIIGAIDILRRRIDAGRYDDMSRFMDAAVVSARRAAALTHRLLAFARRQPLDPKPVDANSLVRGMEELLRRTLGEQIVLIAELEPSPWLALSDSHQLENAILNLAINSRDAMPDGGKLVIATRNVELSAGTSLGQESVEPGAYISVSVTDTGIGMTPEILNKVFEPFFTTKPIGEGTGLGLSMVYGFVRQSRGHIRIESTVGAGTTVSIFLPRHIGHADDAPAGQAAPLLPGAGETVLLVEDDSAVRLLIGEVLRELGYTCMEVGDGQAALPIIRSNARIDLVITDVGLPGINGKQLADIARQHRPGLRILFVTGYAERALGQSKLLEHGMEMLTKPFTLDALAAKIREMLPRVRPI